MGCCKSAHYTPSITGDDGYKSNGLNLATKKDSSLIFEIVGPSLRGSRYEMVATDARTNPQRLFRPTNVEACFKHNNNPASPSCGTCSSDKKEGVNTV